MNRQVSADSLIIIQFPVPFLKKNVHIDSKFMIRFRNLRNRLELPQQDDVDTVMIK